jgi:hypothetical protein
MVPPFGEETAKPSAEGHTGPPLEEETSKPSEGNHMPLKEETAEPYKEDLPGDSDSDSIDTVLCGENTNPALTGLPGSFPPPDDQSLQESPTRRSHRQREVRYLTLNESKMGRFSVERHG